MRDESNNLGGAGQLVTAMLAQFTNSDVTIPVWGFTLGPSEVCTCTLHTFSTLPSLLLLYSSTKFSAYVLLKVQHCYKNIRVSNIE